MASQLGFFYSRYHVDYENTIHYPDGRNITGYAFSDLKYPSVPVTARLALARVKKVQFYLDAGLYAAALIDYKAHADIPNWLSTTYHNRSEVFTDDKIKMDHGLYKIWDWGAVAGLSAKYIYSTRLSFSTSVQMLNSFVKDIEDKNEMKSNGGINAGTYFFWQGFVYKGLPNAQVGLGGYRGHTQLQAFSVSISCNLKI
ncbi:MAG: hypothetical protein JST36_08325 [Bacteroidetes bacterium]|nr:hypothetical protein [Bacteroidota bacterium]